MNDVPYLADFGPNPTEPQLQAEPARVIAANGIGPGAGKGARAEATERELLRVSAFDLVRSGC